MLVLITLAEEWKPSCTLKICIPTAVESLSQHPVALAAIIALDWMLVVCFKHQAGAFDKLEGEDDLWVQRPLKATVEPISFSAHADYTQTSGFVQKMAPANVILVHGEHKEMDRLKRSLEALGTETGNPWVVHAPKITKTVTLFHKPVYPVQVIPEQHALPIPRAPQLGAHHLIWSSGQVFYSYSLYVVSATASSLKISFLGGTKGGVEATTRSPVVTACPSGLRDHQPCNLEMRCEQAQTPVKRSVWFNGLSYWLALICKQCEASWPCLSTLQFGSRLGQYESLGSHA